MEEERNKQKSPPIINQITKKMSPLTNNDSSDSKDHKGVSYEESLHIILRDALHSLLGQQRSGLDPGSDLVETTLAPLWVLPVALSHGWNSSDLLWKRAGTWTPLSCGGNTVKVSLIHLLPVALPPLCRTSPLVTSVLIEREGHIVRVCIRCLGTKNKLGKVYKHSVTLFAKADNKGL